MHYISYVQNTKKTHRFRFFSVHFLFNTPTPLLVRRYTTTWLLWPQCTDCNVVRGATLMFFGVLQPCRIYFVQPKQQPKLVYYIFWELWTKTINKTQKKNENKFQHQPVCIVTVVFFCIRFHRAKLNVCINFVCYYWSPHTKCFPSFCLLFKTDYF